MAETAQPDRRPLTPGEIAMLRSVYGTRIPYEKVKVSPHRWTWPFPQDRSMAPNGNMYFPGKEYVPDFSDPKVDMVRRSVFVHEGTHIFQWYVLQQTVWARGPFSRTYDYTLVPKKPWTSYGLEQMAMIAQDYWLKKHGGPTQNPAQYPMALYDAILPAH